MASLSADQQYPTAFTSPALGQPKVAIPRLQGTHALAKDRRRVPRACTSCRSHKIKCTGQRPQCKHCAATGRECVYVMSRKDRLKSVTDRCIQMASLLKALKASAGVEYSVKIATILELVEEELPELHQTSAKSAADPDTYIFQEGSELCGVYGHEEMVTCSLDWLDENLHEDNEAHATGFVGRNSEVQWLRAVALAQAERPSEESSGLYGQRTPSSVPVYAPIVSFSYWMDSDDVDFEANIDPHKLPHSETARLLLRSFMSKVHDSFPILSRKSFEDQFQVYFQAVRNGNPPRLSPKWQTILNLVFAIGAKYSQLAKAELGEHESDHLIYQARARALSLNEKTLSCHSDLPQIQGLGLLAFYWLSIGQVSRAWTMIGMALRSAYCLGLHVRNEDPSIPAVTRETLVRTWWSLYSLERTLSVITGRPSIIVDSCCSVPLPMPVPEEQISDEVEAAYRLRQGSSTALGAASPTFSVCSNNSCDLDGSPRLIEANSGSYFRATIQLAIITQNILTSLNQTTSRLRTPNEIQLDTIQLLQRLDRWATTLSIESYSQQSPNDLTNYFARERMNLRLQFCSAKILLTRPNLTIRLQPWNETQEPCFPRHMASICIEAATAIVSVLPDEPRPELIYDQSPGWCIVHHLMQAVSVFLLGLLQPSSTPEETMRLKYAVKRALSWLEVIQDPFAERAHALALRLFQDVSRQTSTPQEALQSQQEASAPTSALQAMSNTTLDGYFPTQLVTMSSSSTIDLYGAYSPITSMPRYPEMPHFHQEFHVAS